jgi:hypothetical protein
MINNKIIVLQEFRSEVIQINSISQKPELPTSHSSSEWQTQFGSQRKDGVLSFQILPDFLW